MANIPTLPAPTLLDNPQAPDIFADASTGWFLHNGNIRITFESARISHLSNPGPLNRVVIGRLVMPVAAAEQMATELLAFLKQQREAQTATGQSAPTIQ